MTILIFIINELYATKTQRDSKLNNYKHIKKEALLPRVLLQGFGLAPVLQCTGALEPNRSPLTQFIEPFKVQTVVTYILFSLLARMEELHKI